MIDPLFCRECPYNDTLDEIHPRRGAKRVPLECGQVSTSVQRRVWMQGAAWSAGLLADPVCGSRVAAAARRCDRVAARVVAFPSIANPKSSFVPLGMRIAAIALSLSAFTRSHWRQPSNYSPGCTRFDRRRWDVREVAGANAARVFTNAHRDVGVAKTVAAIGRYARDGF